jgi:hypothetical protein
MNQIENDFKDIEHIEMLNEFNQSSSNAVTLDEVDATLFNNNQICSLLKVL